MILHMTPPGTNPSIQSSSLSLSLSPLIKKKTRRLDVPTATIRSHMQSLAAVFLESKNVLLIRVRSVAFHAGAKKRCVSPRDVVAKLNIVLIMNIAVVRLVSYGLAPSERL